MKRFLTVLILLLGCRLCLAGDTLKVMSFNLRFGELASMEQIADSIASVNPDIVLLQECDWNTSRKRAPAQNGVRFVNVLADHTGMFGLFGKAINYCGGYYGVGILSKYPIIASERVLLPWDGKTEQRCLLTADVELPSGRTVTVASTHLEVRSDVLRVEQAKFVTECLKRHPNPVILAGDMNAEPGTPEIDYLQKEWKDCTNAERTFSTYKLECKIDYILVHPAKEFEVLGYERLDRIVLSDHYPILSTVELK